MQRSCHILAFKPPAFLLPTWYLPPSAPSPPPHVTGCFHTACFLFLLDSLRSGFFNETSFLAKRAELIHFISFHPVDLICIHDSSFSSSSSFLNPDRSALRSDCTHFRSGILSPDHLHASGGIIVFVRQVYPSLKFPPPLSLRLAPTMTMYRSTFH